METQSSFLAWEIPWTEDPGGLQSMRLQRVRHDLVIKQVQQYFSMTQLLGIPLVTDLHVGKLG